MALSTVQDYIIRARVLLQDTVPEYRYPDQNFIDALNEAFLESRRLRPDLFIGRMNAVPDYSLLTDIVVMDQQYRMCFVYFMCGQVQLMDDEGTQDERAAAFLQKFSTVMIAPEASSGA